MGKGELAGLSEESSSQLHQLGGLGSIGLLGQFGVVEGSQRVKVDEARVARTVVKGH